MDALSLRPSRRALALGLLMLLTAIDAPSQVTRLERLSPSRSLVPATIPAPLSVKVRALNAQGEPVAGVLIMAGVPSTTASGPTLQDQFGFKGFNIPREGVPYCGGLPPSLDAFMATTDASGVAQITPPLLSTSVGSGFPIVARWMKSDCLGGSPTVQTHFPTVVIGSAATSSASVVVEYFNASLAQYFSTLIDEEIAKLDAGVFKGWRQSIGAFAAYANSATAPSDTVPVCRFWNSMSSAHFYFASKDECDAVQALYPETWVLETTSAFWVYLPDTSTGACGADQVPIYRMYNNSASPGHRYITDRRLRDWMVGAGWIAEGYGREAVMMCAPS